MVRMPGHYSHVHTGQPVPRNYRRLKLCEVANMVMKAEIKTIEFWRAVISECLGTMFYVLLGCSSTLLCGNFYDYKYDIVMLSFAFGFTMATLVQCFGHISGAHFNPVVSLAMVITCKVTPLRGILYCIAQCGGGIAGAAILYGITPRNCHSELGVTSLNQVSIWQGLGIETLLTFILVFTVFATVDTNRKELGSKPLAIGVSVILCHLSGYRFTKSAMNPARALGPAFVMNKWDNHWIYWLGPLVGGLMSGLLYEYIFDPSRNRRKPRSIEESPSYPDPDEEDGSTMPQTSTSSPTHVTYMYGNHVPTSYESNLGGTYGNHVNSNHGNHINDSYSNHCATNTEVGTNYGAHANGRRGYNNYIPVDNSNSGTENHAYTFDTHPRRIPPPPPIRNAHMTQMPNEEILLDDVRADPFPGRQG